MKHAVGVYFTRKGVEVRLTERQEKALQAACMWQTLGYRFSRYTFAGPTHSDREIAGLCFKAVAHIGMLHSKYRSPDFPYLVSSPNRFEPSAVCVSFEDSVKCARELFNCDVVTVPAKEFQPGFDDIAARWHVAILIV
jgi:hypothetical protein